jgi:hypothetical protein
MDILGYIVTDPRNHFRKLCPFPQKNEDITAPTNKLA